MSLISLNNESKKVYLYTMMLTIHLCEMGQVCLALEILEPGGKEGKLFYAFSFLLCTE